MQPEANGTGGAVRRRRASTSTRDAPVRGPQRRRAAASPPRRSGSSSRRTKAAQRHDGDDAARRPDRLRPRRAPRRTDPSSGSSRPRSDGDATRAGARDHARSTPASTCSTAPPCSSALPKLTADNAQGELYLPQVLDSRRGTRRRPPRRRPDARARRQRPRRARRRPARSPSGASSTTTCARASTIIDPASTHVDVDVDDRPGHDARARHRAQRRDDRSGDDCTRRRRTSYAVDCHDRGRREASARSPTCALAPTCAQGAKVGTFVEVKNSDIGARHEGAAPLLHRRRRRRRGLQPRRRRRSPPTTTAKSKSKHRTTIGDRVQVQCRHFVRRAGDGRRRRLHCGGIGDHRRRAAQARSASRASGSATSRGTPTAAEQGTVMSDLSATLAPTVTAATSLPIDYDKRLMLFSGPGEPGAGGRRSPTSSASTSARSRSRPSPTARSTAATRSRSAALTSSSCSRPAATRPRASPRTTR